MTAPALLDMPVTLDDAEARMIAETKAQSLTPDDAAYQRDANGRFVSASGAVSEVPPAQRPDAAGPVVPVEGAPAPAAPPAEGEDAAPAIPDGYVAPPTLTPERAKGFKVLDADGEILPPDLTWKFVADGKELSLSTDKLINYAQMGRYNHGLQLTAQQAQQRVEQVSQEYQSVQQTVQTRDAQIEALLSDPDYYARAVDAFALHNTPEHRAQRERDALAQERQQMDMDRMSQQATAFIDTRMAPALDWLQSQYDTITHDEIAAKFFLAARPYVRNGVLRPEAFPLMSQWAVQELEPYMRMVHAQRAEERTAPKKVAAAATAQAQIQSQKAKSLATKATKPTGRAMAESAPPPKLDTLKDTEDFVIAETKRQMRLTG